MTNSAHPRTLDSRALISAVAVAAALAGGGLASAAVPRGSGGGSGFGTTTTTPAVTQLNTTVSVSGDGLDLKAHRGTMQGHKLTVSGTAPAADSGDKIALQYKAANTKTAKWTAALKFTVGAKGRFRGIWKPAVSGQFSLRAKLLPAATGSASTEQPAAGSTPPATVQTGTMAVDIFKTSEATLYGPGFWGNKTACGETLRKKTIGVANRTLKCGTKVAIDYNGEELVARVIDRGPYSGKASWDLTMATAKALGIDSTSDIGTLTPAPK